MHFQVMAKTLERDGQVSRMMASPLAGTSPDPSRDPFRDGFKAVPSQEQCKLMHERDCGANTVVIDQQDTKKRDVQSTDHDQQLDRSRGATHSANP